MTATVLEASTSSFHEIGMRKNFPGYYQPTANEFSTLWETCTFVLDANVLLNLYRYSAETRKKLLEILKQVSNRVWVPHRAALEYQRNRLDVISKQRAAYDEIEDLLRTLARSSQPPCVPTRDIHSSTPNSFSSQSTRRSENRSST